MCWNCWMQWTHWVSRMLENGFTPSLHHEVRVLRQSIHCRKKRNEFCVEQIYENLTEHDALRRKHRPKHQQAINVHFDYLTYVRLLCMFPLLLWILSLLLIYDNYVYFVRADSSETFLAEVFRILALKRTPLRPVAVNIDTTLSPCVTDTDNDTEISTTTGVNVYNGRNKKRGRKRDRKLSCYRQIKHGNKRSPVDLARRTPPKKIDNRKTTQKSCRTVVIGKNLARMIQTYSHTHT